MTREEIREMDPQAYDSWRRHEGGELAYGVESREAAGKRGADAMRSIVTDPKYADDWVELMRARRARGQRILDAIPGVSCPLPEGGFYFWANVSRLGTCGEVRDWLLADAQVGVGPGTWFTPFGEGYLRIMYGAVPNEELVD